MLEDGVQEGLPVLLPEVLLQVQVCSSGDLGSKLRYPLRSAGKVEKPAASDAPVTSSTKRGRPPSSVSKSVDVLNLSAKEKSAKPSRRLSNPTKRTANPSLAPLGNITPISETRTVRTDSQGRNDTPLSEISSRRRKFNVLASVSYWLTQIKLAESASRHSISLGFFKLAFESGCEPLQRMRDELKSYAVRHNLLSELADVTQDLLQLYDVSEDFEKLKISEDGSPSEEQTTLNEDAQRGNLKPRSLNPETRSITAPIKKERGQKKQSTAKNTTSISKNMVNSVSVKEADGKLTPKGSQRLVRNSQKDKIKSSTDDTVDLPTTKLCHEDKENMDVSSMEDGAAMEETETS